MNKFIHQDGLLISKKDSFNKVQNAAHKNLIRTISALTRNYGVVADLGAPKRRPPWLPSCPLTAAHALQCLLPDVGVQEAAIHVGSQVGDAGNRVGPMPPIAHRM